MIMSKLSQVNIHARITAYNIKRLCVNCVLATETVLGARELRVLESSCSSGCTDSACSVRELRHWICNLQPPGTLAANAVVFNIIMCTHEPLHSTGCVQRYPGFGLGEHQYKVFYGLYLARRHIVYRCTMTSNSRSKQMEAFLNKVDSSQQRAMSLKTED